MKITRPNDQGFTAYFETMQDLKNFTKFVETLIENVKAKTLNARFVEHIEKHLAEHYPGEQVICKICGKTIDQIAKEGES